MLRTGRWYLLFGLIIGYFCFISLTEGYFEEKYWCQVTGNTIQVSLSTGDNLCFGYLSDIHELVQETSQDIDRAKINVERTSGTDKMYRQSVVDQLVTQKHEYERIQEHIGFAMQDFEKELFVRVKSIVGYYLFPYTTTLQEKVMQGNRIYTRLVSIGNTEQVVFVRRELDRWTYELTILEKIKGSNNFFELIPMLRLWFDRNKTM